MGDSQAPPVASWCQMIPTPAPFLSPFLFQMGRPRSKMNGRTEIPTSPSPRTKFKPSGLQSHWTRSLLPGASLSVSFFTLLFTLIKATLPPTFKIDPGSYVASVGSTIAPTRVLNFPSDSKKKKGDHRVLSTIVWGNRRSPAPRSLPAPLSALQQRASIHSTTSNILTHFRKEILLTYSGSSIQVFSYFPLSFHSAVAPCAPPPLHSGPSSVPPLGDQARERVWFSHGASITALMSLRVCARWEGPGQSNVALKTERRFMELLTGTVL